MAVRSGEELSDEDIEKAVKEAAEYEAQDKRKKEAVDARNEADAMVVQTEKALKDVGDKISESEKADVEAEIQNVKDILERTKDKEMTEDEVSELKAAHEKMMEKSQALFTKMYESMQGAAGAGPDMSGFTGGTTGGSDDGSDGGASAGGSDDFAGDYREV